MSTSDVEAYVDQLDGQAGAEPTARKRLVGIPEEARPGLGKPESAANSPSASSDGTAATAEQLSLPARMLLEGALAKAAPPPPSRQRLCLI